MLDRPDKVRGELRRCQLGADPLAGRFAVLLKALLHHQFHGLPLGHGSGVNLLVQDGVHHGTGQHLELLHLEASASEAVLDHQLFRIDGPAFDERARGENGADHRVGPRSVRVRDLQVVPGHGFVNGEISQHVVVVLAVERQLAGRAPTSRCRRNRVERLSVLFQGAGGIAVRRRDAAAELRHDDDLDRPVGHGHQALGRGELSDLFQATLGVRDDRLVGRVSVGQLVKHRSDHGPRRSVPASECEFRYRGSAVSYSSC